jgi:hypothetical protein
VLVQPRLSQPAERRPTGRAILKDARKSSSTAKTPRSRLLSKQLGSWLVDDLGGRVFLNHWKGENPQEWPPDLQVQQLPEVFK